MAHSSQGPDGLCSRRAVGDGKSSPGANQIHNFVSGRQPSSLLLGVNLLAVNENVQTPGRAKADTSGNLQFAFDAIFQAHGLRFDVVSKETTLDVDSHRSLVITLSPTAGA
jgi:hypothetical protein